MLFVFGTSDPAVITARLSFQLQKHIYVFDEKPALACFMVVLDHLILVDFIYLEYSLPLFHGQPDLHYVHTGEGPLLILGMPTFFNGGSVNACSTQAEHELIITSVWKDRVIPNFGRNDRTFDQASIARHASLSLHASPT